MIPIIIRTSSLATLGQSSAFTIAVTIIVNFTTDIKHHLAFQTLTRQCRGLLRDGGRQRRRITVNSARVAGHGVVSRWFGGSVSIAAALEVIAQVKRVTRSEVKAIVVLGKLQRKVRQFKIFSDSK
jgi:hypothetical protein